MQLAQDADDCTVAHPADALLDRLYGGAVDEAARILDLEAVVEDRDEDSEPLNA